MNKRAQDSYQIYEAVNQMTLEECYLEVAKIEGVDQREHLEKCWHEGPTEDGEDGYDGFICPRCGRSTYFQLDTGCIPRWDCDLNKTWELVEKMADWGDLFIESWQDGEWFIANHPLVIKPRGLARCDGIQTGKRDIILAVLRAYIARQRLQELGLDY